MIHFASICPLSLDLTSWSAFRSLDLPAYLLLDLFIYLLPYLGSWAAIVFNASITSVPGTDPQADDPEDPGSSRTLYELQ